MEKKKKKWLSLFLAVILAFTGLPVSLMAAGNAKSQTQETTKILPSQTSGEINCFSYESFSGKSWTYNDDEAYIDLGSSNEKAEECFYRVTFTGNAIEVFANKTLNDMSYITSDENIASVSAQGTVTAKKSGTAVITASSQKAGISRTMEVEVREQGSVLGGTVTDHNTQYTQKRFAEVSVKKNRSETLTAWKNDRAVSELVLSAIGGDFTNVTVQASDLTDGKKKIAAENVTATFIRSTKAYVYGYIYGNDVPAATEENRAEASDILWQSTPIDIKADTLQPVWVEFAIPKTAKSGTYKTQLTVTADQLDKPLVFEYEVRVQNAELPDNYRDTFDIELWQYPYTSAEYYNVEPFSDEHLEIMKSSMELYKKAGGHAITASIIEDAWDGQTYSANDVHYPSMIKWIKNGDSFTYDYTDFDKWVSFNKSLGIGDKIVLYSVAPWHNSFTYWENGKLVKEGFSVGSTRYTTLWTDFLTDLAAHLTEKGWFDDSYIGIDERGFSGTAFDLIESVKNKDGKCLKTAGAMDSFVEKKDLAMRVTDLNVGDTAAAAHPADFEQLVKDREAKGLRTTLYSCTGHRPGNFSLSAPVESYWSIVNAGKSGTAGFLRWAYDAWVEDPLDDTTHSKFEPGDCFLIYPDEKTAQNPISRSSVRLERMAEGVRDVNKLAVIKKEAPQLAEQIQKLYAGILTTAQGGHPAFLTDAQITTLSAEMDTFQAGIASLTDQYIELTGRTEESETETESETKKETESETKPTESETAATEKPDPKPQPDTKETKPSESETKQQMPSTEIPAKAKPAKVKGLSVKAVSKGKLVLKWKKVRNADGYVVYRADKKKGKYKKVKVLNGARKISFTNKKLKKKKTYYYKVCAYRKVGKKKVYGSCSAVKSRKVK